MERVHVDYSAHRPGVTVGRGVAHMAVQLRLGLLPERRSGSGGCDCTYFGIDGTSLAHDAIRRLSGLST